MAVTLLYLNKSNAPPPAWAIGGSFLFGACVSFWIVRSLIGRLRWRLTDSELIGASMAKTITRYLRSRRLSPDCPIWCQIPGARTCSTARSRGLQTSARKRAAADFPGRFDVSPGIHGVGNGAGLKLRLAERLKDRVVHNYTFSEKELRLLKRAEVNRFIPESRPSSSCPRRLLNHPRES